MIQNKGETGRERTKTHIFYQLITLDIAMNEERTATNNQFEIIFSELDWLKKIKPQSLGSA